MPISAGVVRNAQHATVGTAIDMTAQLCGAAGQQVGNDFLMLWPQWLLILIIRNMLPENLGYLQWLLFKT